MGCLLLCIGSVPVAIGPLLAGFICEAQVKTQWHAANHDIFVTNTTCQQAGFSQREKGGMLWTNPVPLSVWSSRCSSSLVDLRHLLGSWKLTLFKVSGTFYFFNVGVCIFLKKEVNNFVIGLKDCVTSRCPSENNCLSALKVTGATYLVVKGCCMALVLQSCVYLSLRRYYTKPICLLEQLQN